MRTLFSLLLLSLAACASTATDAHPDAATADAPAADGSLACDPHRTPCRVTLTCADLERCDALSLATGRIETYDHGVIARPGDVRIDLGRYLTLTASSDVCRFGGGTGTSTASFATLTDVPTDPSRCAWTTGPNLLCGVNTSAYTPTCVGDGLLVRDGAAQLYRLRVVADRADPMGWHMDVEWVAIDP